MGTIKFSFRKYGLNVFFKSNSFFSLALSMGQKHDNFTNQGFDFFTGPPPQLEGVIFFLDSLRRDFRSGLQERFCIFVPVFCFDEEILRKNMTI